MGRIIMPNTPPICPLCDKRMVNDILRPSWYACRKCQIAIAKGDPMIAKWNESFDDEKIKCPNPKCDDEPMRVFMRIDGYMKAKCLKCKATLESDDDR